jgi:hypothetical protein
LILAMLAELFPRDRWRIFMVTLSTLLRWHRDLVRRWWDLTRLPPLAESEPAYDG